MGFFNSNNPFRHAAEHSAPSNNNNVDDVPPPLGPPPSHQQQGGQSNINNTNNNDYAPPPGPPPSYTTKSNEDYAVPPPDGPPPGQQQQQQHPWESLVPDTSLFPPPPDIFSGFDRSSASNATEEQAEAGELWCKRYPLGPPLDLQHHHHHQQQGGWNPPTRLIQPETNTFQGSLQPKEQGTGGGVWTLLTEKKAGDATVIGYPPVYLVQRDSPLLASTAAASSPSAPKTIYYECKILSSSSFPPPTGSSSSSSSSSHHLFHRSHRNQNNKTGEIGLAIGFTALPYPPFRMPGWHRGSLAVHADDGHKYVNDRWGGKEFTKPFRAGETVGIGMVFSCPSSTSSSSKPPFTATTTTGSKGLGGSGGRIEVEVFFTRDGKVDGRWDVHEELDASTDLPVTGLEGYHDLAIAVGTFQNVAVEIVLDPARWVYRGVQQ